MVSHLDGRDPFALVKYNEYTASECTASEYSAIDSDERQGAAVATRLAASGCEVGEPTPASRSREMCECCGACFGCITLRAVEKEQQAFVQVRLQVQPAPGCRRQRGYCGLSHEVGPICEPAILATARGDTSEVAQKTPTVALSTAFCGISRRMRQSPAVLIGVGSTLEHAGV